MRVAAVDCGTNTVRLLIADVAPGRDLVDVERRQIITRLGKDVDATRAFDPEAIARTLAVLADYGQAISDAGCAAVRMAATSAARDATNFEAFAGPAGAAVGVSPEILSGHEEARLAFLGATSALAEERGPFLVVDIGGGSTEFVLGDGGGQPRAAASADMGSVRITEKFIATDPPAPEELAEALSFVADHLVEVEAVVRVAEARCLVGVAGTITTLAAVALGLDRHDPRRTHHHFLSHRNVEALFRRFASETVEERREDPAIEPGRADVITAGTLILVAVLRRWGFDGVLVSEKDVLDGIALSLLP